MMENLRKNHFSVDFGIEDKELNNLASFTVCEATIPSNDLWRVNIILTHDWRLFDYIINWIDGRNVTLNIFKEDGSISRSFIIIGTKPELIADVVMSWEYDKSTVVLPILFNYNHIEYK